MSIFPRKLIRFKIWARYWHWRGKSKVRKTRPRS